MVEALPLEIRHEPPTKIDRHRPEQALAADERLSWRSSSSAQN
jgi:hypothetical protein